MFASDHAKSKRFCVSLLQMYSVRSSVHDYVRSYIAEKHNLVFGLTWPRRWINNVDETKRAVHQ